MRKVLYLTKAVVPSTSANSLHVMKMSEAFAFNKFNTYLWVRPESEYELKDIKNEYSFYGVNKSFKIIKQPAASTLYKKIIRKLRLDLIIKLIQINPDIIYGRDIDPILFCTNFGYKVILELHGPLNEKYIHRINNLLNKKRIGKIIVITHSLKSIIMNQLTNLTNEMILVEPDAVNLKKFDKMIDKDIAKINLGFKKTDFTIGYVGNLSRGRGIEQILEIALKLPDELFFIIGGRTKQRIETLKNLIQSKNVNNVFVFGFIPNSELLKYYSAIDILLLPYQKKVEVFSGGDITNWTSPLKLFEYMATGREIVASNHIPGLNEILTDERNCLMVDWDNINQWISAIKKIKKNGHKYGENASKDVRQYTWDKRVSRIISNVDERKI